MKTLKVSHHPLPSEHSHQDAENRRGVVPTTDHVGGDGRLAAITKYETFLATLGTHCRKHLSYLAIAAEIPPAGNVVASLDSAAN